jgi:hypothetical protein
LVSPIGGIPFQALALSDHVYTQTHCHNFSNNLLNANLLSVKSFTEL